MSIILGIVVVAVMSAMSIYANSILPQSSRLPMQWGFGGRVNRWAPRAMALWFSPVLAMAVLGVILALADTGSRHFNLLFSATALAFLVSHALHLWLMRCYLSD